VRETDRNIERQIQRDRERSARERETDYHRQTNRQRQTDRDREPDKADIISSIPQPGDD